MKKNLYPLLRPAKCKFCSYLRMAITPFLLFFTLSDTSASTSFFSTYATICQNSNVTFSVNNLALSSNTNVPAPFEAIKMYLHNGTSYVLLPATGSVYSLITDNNGNGFKEEFRVNMNNDPLFIGVKFLRIELVDGAGNVAIMNLTLTVGNCQTYMMDYGDAPDATPGTGIGNYNTTATDNGPAHLISQNLFIGTIAPDADPGDLQKDGALTDDISNTGSVDDEDGVTIMNDLYIHTTTYSVTVAVTNNSGSAATLSGWIDFNKNGIFEESERMQSSVPDGATTATLTWTGIAGLSAGPTYARFRIASNPLEVANPTGIAGSGEIEDYLITIKPSYTVCGTVFIDVNGLTDNTVNGMGTNANNTIYAVLVNSNGNTAAYTSVEANGTYCFYGVVPQNYSVILSTTQAVINAPAPSPSLPPLWQFSGENIGTGPGNDGLINGTLHFVVSNSNITDVNFGVQSPAEIGLAISLSRFYAVQQQCKANLKWETLQESNSDKFEIEQSTDGGISFSTIGIIAAAGSSNDIIKYEFLSPLKPGINGFRLKMVDIGGTFKYSTLVLLKCDSKTQITVFPNPVTSQINIVGLPDDIKSVSIVSIHGTNLGLYKTTAGSISINTSALPSGTYILRIEGAFGLISNYKFIKD